MPLNILFAAQQQTSDPLFRTSVEEAVWKTAENISPLYRLDAFDWTILTLYFALLSVLALYGAYRIKQVVDFWRYRRLGPEPRALYAEGELPRVTVQLPLFNEMYVVERLLAAVAATDYPDRKSTRLNSSHLV